jgi:peroxiredoxin Q/BCP
MPRANPGDTAPPFALHDQAGRQVSLADFAGRAVVLFFYPKNETRVCTTEACAFRDSHEVFTDAGAVVIGISGDSESSHASFAEHHSLPFTLLSDTGGAVSRAYDARLGLGLLPSRVTFVIDGQGVIRHRFTSQLSATPHVEEALAVVRRLAGG